MIAHSEGDEADDRQDGADRVERAAASGPATSGTKQRAGDEGDDARSGTLTRKTEPHQKCSSRKPPATRADGDAERRRRRPRCRWPGPLVRSGKTLVRIDSVAGMISAAPMPMSARVDDQLSGEVDERGRQRADAEDDEADGERALAAEAVAERCRR